MPKPFPREAHYVVKTTQRHLFGGQTVINTPCEILDRTATEYTIRIFGEMILPDGFTAYPGETITVPRGAVEPAAQPIPLGEI